MGVFMNWVVNGHNILGIIFITFLVSVILVPLAKKIAIHVGALDIPDARKVHKHPTPRMGGLAIYCAFLLGYMLFGKLNIQIVSILIGSFLIVILGMLDDIKPIRALYKFIVQIIAAIIVVVYGQIYFTKITFLGLNLEFNLITSYVLSVFFIVSITNAINLIDGLDGLSSGISSIYFLTISIIAMLLGKFSGLDVTLSLIMLGATLGFLFHNFPPAKIFMGDSGSLFLGFMISVIALVSYKVATLTSLVIPIVILAIPIFDTVLAIFRRLLKGESIGAPDKEHFHHQLLKLKFSPRVSIIIIYLVNILFSAVSIFYVIGNTKVAIVLYLFLMLALLFLILKTDILYQHKDKNKK
ncbi:MAG: undecaprenyl/decaprenyl-phosphate alpha-N-acetylglucosaminyl 1-phosphate transferase [Firmicutes bacterium]|nr:undecaprenyl/decaprenyl-phosphate alpha-N-acetylglucosaminyl 1-phosphate transferase [Bacillota bacterium]